MQRKLLAIAVAGALTPAAAMAQSSVEIYGRANLSAGIWKATGAALTTGNLDSRTRVVDGGSRLGFRVNESLGGGLRAFVVLESGVNFDTGNGNGQSGAANASTGQFASRDSYIGIGGGWGDIRLGRQSIWWSNGVLAQTGANYIDNAVDGLITGGRSGVATPVARNSNTISYNTPTVGGFNASFSYSTNHEGAAPGSVGVSLAAGGTATFTTAAAGFTGTGQEKDQIWGITARYTSGALRGQIDWAVRENVGFVDGRDNTGLKFGLGWAYAPGSQISFVHSMLSNDNTAANATLGTAAGTDLETDVTLINWEHMMGQWQLLAQYTWSKEIDGAVVDDTGMKGFTLAAKYFLSKRTGVYVSFHNVKTEVNDWSDISGGGFSSAGATGLGAGNRGADMRSMAVGVMHNF
jgi:predicted porin